MTIHRIPQNTQQYTTTIQGDAIHRRGRRSTSSTRRPCVWMYRTDTRRRGILLVLQCIRKYLPKSISAYLPELTWYPMYLVPSERNFSHGGTQPMAAIANLNTITDISGVDRWQHIMLKDLPTPESAPPFLQVGRRPPRSVLEQGGGELRRGADLG